jgi:hypothetical protein
MSDLPYERLIVAVQAAATMEGALEATAAYVKSRKAFGKTLMEFQNTRFKLAEIATITRVARTFIDSCIQQQLQGALDDATASMAKWWATDMAHKVLDECVQLHGGYGYMSEYLVARMYADARVPALRRHERDHEGADRPVVLGRSCHLGADHAPQHFAHLVVRQLAAKADALGNPGRAQALAHPLLQRRCLSPGPFLEDHGSAHRLTPLLARDCHDHRIGHGRVRQQRLLNLPG